MSQCVRTIYIYIYMLVLYYVRVGDVSLLKVIFISQLVFITHY